MALPGPYTQKAHMTNSHNMSATVFVYEHRKTGEVRAEYIEAALSIGHEDEHWNHVATLEPRMWIQAHWRAVQDVDVSR